VDRDAKFKSQREINGIKADIEYLQKELSEAYGRLASYVALQPFTEEMNNQLVGILKSFKYALERGMSEVQRQSMLAYVNDALFEYGPMKISLITMAKQRKSNLSVIHKRGTNESRIG
jgi:hypothetical protein